jgi:hypothetical protein
MKTTPPSAWPPIYWRKHAEAQERTMRQAMTVIDACLERMDLDRVQLRALRDEIEERRRGMARVLASVEAPSTDPCDACGLTWVKGPAYCHLADSGDCPQGLRPRTTPAPTETP